MSIFNLFALCGGLALFLFGMHLMGESLEKQTGSKLKPILENLTSKPLKGVLLGTGVTAVIQSSSATTVMAVGFVNSGIMKLRQAIYVVMGANIGTTITAWLLSLTGIESNNFWLSLLKPASFSPLLALLGIILLFASKRKKDTAGILLGFAILMFGMEQMSTAVKGLAQLPAFTSVLLLFANPLFGVLVGALVTAIVQSSSASVGILQALANTGSLSYGAALPIIMGQNIGTCITAILSAIGANKNAKRVAAVHLYFNIIGTAVFLSLYYFLNLIFKFSFATHNINALGIAVVHSLFNLFSTMLLLPFAPKLEELAKRTIRDGKEQEVFEMLDDRLLNTPSIAIEQCRKLTMQMAQLSQDSLNSAIKILDNYEAKTADKVLVLEDMIDQYEDKLGSFLVKVSMRNLTQNDSREVAKLLHIIGDFERISDHAINLVESAEEIHRKKLNFSAQAQTEIRVISAAVHEILELTVQAFLHNNLDIAEQVEPLEEVIDQLRADIKAGHIDRLQAGDCTIELGFVLSDLLTNLERCADHCSNVAASLIEMERLGKLDAHEYLKTLRSGQAGQVFQARQEHYQSKYSLQNKS